jgi:acyl carrier protein
MLHKIVNDFLLTQTSVTPEKLADTTLKMGELGLDSLGVVEMLFEVEDQYGIHIEDAMQYQNMTLTEVINHMEQTIRAKHGGELPNLISADKS